MPPHEVGVVAQHKAHNIRKALGMFWLLSDPRSESYSHKRSPGDMSVEPLTMNEPTRVESKTDV